MFEIREVQTHYYNTTNTEQITKVVINTLQDNGFVIQNVEDELGYLRAKKGIKTKKNR